MPPSCLTMTAHVTQPFEKTGARTSAPGADRSKARVISGKGGHERKDESEGGAPQALLGQRYGCFKGGLGRVRVGAMVGVIGELPVGRK